MFVFIRDCEPGVGLWGNIGKKKPVLTAERCFLCMRGGMNVLISPKGPRTQIMVLGPKSL